MKNQIGTIVPDVGMHETAMVCRQVGMYTHHFLKANNVKENVIWHLQQTLRHER